MVGGIAPLWRPQAASGPATGDRADRAARRAAATRRMAGRAQGSTGYTRSEEHTSELQSLMRSSYTVFCLKKTHDRTPETHAHLQYHHMLQRKKTANKTTEY